MSEIAPRLHRRRAPGTTVVSVYGRKSLPAAALSILSPDVAHRSDMATATTPQRLSAPDADATPGANCRARVDGAKTTSGVSIRNEESRDHCAARPQSRRGTYCLTGPYGSIVAFLT